MKTTRILWAAVILAASTVGQTTPAFGWTLDQLNPFRQKEAKEKPASRTVNKPSALERLGDGTKGLFSNVKNALTPKWSAKGKSPLKPHTPWGRNARSQRNNTPKKPSWFSSLFRLTEPKPPQTMDEWMSLDTPEF